MLNLQPEGWVTLRLRTRTGQSAGVYVNVDLGTVPGVLDHEALTRRAARMLREGLAELSPRVPLRGDAGALTLRLAVSTAAA